jgi:hypothetical protein
LEEAQIAMKALFICVSLIISLSRSAFSNEVALFETESAVASFVAAESECVQTFTNVFVSNHIERHERIPVAGAFLSIKRENICTKAVLVDAVGAPVLQATAFSVKGNIKRATLESSFQAFEFVTNSEITVVVNLKWSNLGRATRSWSMTSDDFIFIVAKEATKTYLASASGQVSIGGENFTPAASQNATISLDKNLFVIRE